MKSIRVVLVDDHPVVLEGLRMLLHASPQIEIVAEATTGEEALRLVANEPPDVLLLDVEMPGLAAVEVARALQAQDTAVLVLSAHDELAYVRQFQQVGVAGYLLKEEAAWIIVEAIQAVARGQRGWYSARIEARLAALNDDIPAAAILSPREIDTLRLVVAGHTNAAIGHALEISEKTVEKHLDSIYRKLNVRSRTEAAVVAMRESLLG